MDLRGDPVHPGPETDAKIAGIFVTSERQGEDEETSQRKSL